MSRLVRFRVSRIWQRIVRNLRQKKTVLVEVSVPQDYVLFSCVGYPP
jgi:hypothetical protein